MIEHVHTFTPGKVPSDVWSSNHGIVLLIQSKSFVKREICKNYQWQYVGK